MTEYGRILIAGAGSALLLIGAFAFQYIGGLVPCTLCVWQRWPHALAVVLALLAVTVLWRVCRPLSLLGSAVMAAGAGIAFYHVGVEQGWWTGPAACTAAGPAGRSAGELLDDILATPLVRCDEVAWEMLGLSMAAWNGLASLGLSAVWIWAAVARPTPGTAR